MERATVKTEYFRLIIIQLQGFVVILSKVQFMSHSVGELCQFVSKLRCCFKKLLRVMV